MERFITVTKFCQHHSIAPAFLHRLHEHGLLSLDRNESEDLLDAEDLATAERLLRLHYDLDINVEGLDVIQHLLQRMNALQTEMAALRNRLRFYEEGPNF